ncbi:PepSY-associated TM helix domain-containing protein [Chishuiella changwenlii]|uniref:PepSY-associated TM helix domain-containing protein n=1 Tax=Chishuiella changwenlii TaxID=1434701 RepID=UPI002FDA7767
MAKEINKSSTWGNTLRKYSRDLHGHLSFFFSGVFLIYLVSGIAMNHQSIFNPQYEVSVKQYKAEGRFPHATNFTKDEIVNLLKPVSEDQHYKKHFYPNPQTLKVFLSTGSSFTVSTSNGQVEYQGIKRRPLFFQLSYLHYNPGTYWRYFSDAFAISMIIVIITGLIMNKGDRGFFGIRGIEFAIGIIIPLLFLIF